MLRTRPSCPTHLPLLPVCVQFVVGLKQLCGIPPRTQHDLVHSPRVAGHKARHIIHLQGAGPEGRGYIIHLQPREESTNEQRSRDVCTSPVTCRRRRTVLTFPLMEMCALCREFSSASSSHVNFLPLLLPEPPPPPALSSPRGGGHL